MLILYLAFPPWILQCIHFLIVCCSSKSCADQSFQPTSTVSSLSVFFFFSVQITFLLALRFRQSMPQTITMITKLHQSAVSDFVNDLYQHRSITLVISYYLLFHKCLISDPNHLPTSYKSLYHVTIFTRLLLFVSISNIKTFQT